MGRKATGDAVIGRLLQETQNPSPRRDERGSPVVPPNLSLPLCPKEGSVAEITHCRYKRTIPSALLTVAAPAWATGTRRLPLQLPGPFPVCACTAFSASRRLSEHRLTSTRPDQRFCVVLYNFLMMLTMLNRIAGLVKVVMQVSQIRALMGEGNLILTTLCPITRRPQCVCGWWCVSYWSPFGSHVRCARKRAAPSRWN